MKLLNILLLSLCLLCFSCKDTTDDTYNPNLSNKVLILKVDYTTNSFEGGIEFLFSQTSNEMTIGNEYVAPGDFGSIRLKYLEIDETVFEGTIIWAGKGQMTFPTTLLPSTAFISVLTNDFISPKAGFQNVFNPSNQTYNYMPIWSSVQHLAKVRQYLSSNPNATVKIFLYTPSVGIGNPDDWDWYLFLKN